jgi:hypothetical protein
MKKTSLVADRDLSVSAAVLSASRRTTRAAPQILRLGAREKAYFYVPRTCSLKLFETEKRTFLRAGIFTGSPVWGLRPMRALL